MYANITWQYFISAIETVQLQWYHVLFHEMCSTCYCKFQDVIEILLHNAIIERGTFMHIKLENIHANRNSVWQFLFRNEEWCWIKLSEGANSRVSFNMWKKVPIQGPEYLKIFTSGEEFFAWKRRRVKIKLELWLRISYVGRTINSCVGLTNSYAGFTYLLRRVYQLLPRVYHLLRTYFLMRSTC